MNQKFSRQSRIKDLLESPVGFDILSRFAMGLGLEPSFFAKPGIGSIKLGTLAKLAGKMLDEKAIDGILYMLNCVEPMQPVRKEGDYEQKDWKELVVYQIYPRSFCDSNGDGVGDLRGIISKLDHVKELGANAIWFSPIFDSPNDDNGYDIRDYKKIMTEFGTMEDFDELLAEAHKRGIKVILDAVLNHSSDEHEWFQRALKGEKKYMDYYYFVEGEPDTPPNNWNSMFSGSAWNYYPEVKSWALHTFSKKQMDLNWTNPELRQALYEQINFWLEKGVDGFRLDVINFISKAEGLPDGSETIGNMFGYRGIENYMFGPKLHEYLRELRANTFDKYGAFTVGETPGTGYKMNQMITADFRKELDTVYCFDHLEPSGRTRFEDYSYDLRFMKNIFTTHQLEYSKNCWNIVFMENHDNPRMVSKVSKDPKYRDIIAKLLATLNLTLSGIPFVYQGQELGMVNADFKEEDLRDVESINYLAELKEVKKMSHQDAMVIINAGSRDHARVPMQWTAGKGVGFTGGTPWLKPSETEGTHFADSEYLDEASVFSYFKKLIALRKSEKALVYGEFTPAEKDKKDLFRYYRTLGEKQWFIEVNLTDKPQKRVDKVDGFTLVASNYDAKSKKLRPYEANIYRVK